MVKTILAGFRRPDIAHVPPEYVELQLTVDSQSLEHLWVRSMCRDGEEMDLGQVRHLMDIMLTERSSMRLSSVEYEEWLEELLKFLNADPHDGSVRKESFLTLFGLWFSSRLWFIPRNRSPIERILLSWEYVDVSGCGVVSGESLSNALLPFAFRVLFPESDKDDSALKSVWMKRMFACVTCKKSDWENHWTEFSNMQAVTFKDVLTDRGTREHMATMAMKYYKIAYTSLTLLDFESLFSLSQDSREQQCRLFSLWLVTLNHGNKDYSSLKSPVEALLGPSAVIRSASAFRAVCKDIWRLYAGSCDIWDEWAEKLLACVSLPCKKGQVLVLRDKLIDRFLSDKEVDALWPPKRKKISPDELMRLLHGIYSSLVSETQDCEGPWITEVWMHEFLALVMRATDSTRPEITASQFQIAFPLFLATVSLSSVQYPHESALPVWPESHEAKLIYSEPQIRNLLRRVWDTRVPRDLNLVCPDWWVDRCCEFFRNRGRGVDRDSFYSIFMTGEETQRIIASLNDGLNRNTLSCLLANATQSERRFVPTDWLSEYFLIADLDMHASDPNQDQFLFAFPLWLAAHIDIQVQENILRTS